VSPSARDERYASFEKAVSIWPSIRLTFDQFSAHLDHHGWICHLPAQPEAFLLCAACSVGSEAACRTIDKTFFPALKLSLTRRYPHWDFVEDVLQKTRERLLVRPSLRIATYRGDGSLAGWLRRVAYRVAADLQRSDAHRRRALFAIRQRCVVDDVPCFGDILAKPQSDAARVATERALFETLTSIGSRNRQLLYMFYVQQLTAEQIGECVGLYRSSVYRRLNHIILRIEKRVVDAVRKQTGINDRKEINGFIRSSYDRIELNAGVWNDVGEGFSGQSALGKRSGSSPRSIPTGAHPA
jgi:RNA polymerase sigma-70 factor